ncbi:hypothetical protein G9A89_000964 [Geosiphon pyriformis]|nr:hypothetical protein G9A89_000964 [Geosiphon pyriformis]
MESNHKQTLTSNIPSATITNDKSFIAIFPFKLEELTSKLLFNKAVLEEKPITIMYTDAKVNEHSIKLILDISLIEFKKEKEKSTWEVYQVSWANKDHNKLLPILSWNDNRKEKQKEKLTWNTDQA